MLSEIPGGGRPEAIVGPAHSDCGFNPAGEGNGFSV